MKRIRPGTLHFINNLLSRLLYWAASESFRQQSHDREHPEVNPQLTSHGPARYHACSCTGKNGIFKCLTDPTIAYRHFGDNNPTSGFGQKKTSS
jgi:hypothetical protein